MYTTVNKVMHMRLQAHRWGTLSRTGINLRNRNNLILGINLRNRNNLILGINPVRAAGGPLHCSGSRRSTTLFGMPEG